MHTLVLTLLFACGTPEVAPAAPPPPVEEPPPTPPVPDPPQTPASLYAECHDRLELPEVAGECTVDADCAPQGCSAEVCAKSDAGVITTCEKTRCAAAVDACGCHEGKCTWTLVQTLPPFRSLPGPDDVQ